MDGFDDLHRRHNSAGCWHVPVLSAWPSAGPVMRGLAQVRRRVLREALGAGVATPQQGGAGNPSPIYVIYSARFTGIRH
jgi:hypothetical protein